MGVKMPVFPPSTRQSEACTVSRSTHTRHLDQKVVRLDSALGSEVHKLEDVDHDVCEGPAKTSGFDVGQIPGAVEGSVPRNFGLERQVTDIQHFKAHLM